MGLVPESFELAKAMVPGATPTRQTMLVLAHYVPDTAVWALLNNTD